MVKYLDSLHSELTSHFILKMDGKKEFCSFRMKQTSWHVLSVNLLCSVVVLQK